MLNDDFDTAVQSYMTATDLGWRSAAFATRSSIYNNVPDTPQFDAVRDRMRALVNAEREKLGMAPL